MHTMPRVKALNPGIFGRYNFRNCALNLGVLHKPKTIIGITFPRKNNLSVIFRKYSTGYESEMKRIRNIGIIAHVDAGKTTTTERMLFYSGFIKRVGEVDRGDTTMDYLPEERERGITINSAAITFGWKEHQINLIDTPGHVDFTIEVERALRVLDGCVAILDGASGVQAQTLNVWKQSNRYKLPKLVFINKLDREGSDWRKCIHQISTKLGSKALLLQLPLFKQELQQNLDEGSIKSIFGTAEVLGDNLPAAIIDAVNNELVLFDASTKSCDNITRKKIHSTEAKEAQHEHTIHNDYLYDKLVAVKTALVESIAELDPDMFEQYLSPEIDGDVSKLTTNEIEDSIRRITTQNMAVPVLMGASYKNFGVQPILDAIKLYLPSPKENSRLGTQLILRPKNEVWAIDDAPLVAFVFKVVVDNLKGVMVFVRIYSGTLQAKATVVNSSISKRSKLVKERVNKIMTIYADYSEEISELKAGNIGVLLGMKHTKTGDTLLDLNHPSIVSGSPEKLSHENPKSTERKLKNINANHSSREVVGVSEKMDNQNAEDGWDVLGGLEKDLVPGENALTHNSTNDDLLQLHKIRIPPPVFFCQIEPDSISDEKHLINVLNNLVLQDPSLNYFRDIEGGDQIILTGMGELHLEVTLSRLLQEKVKAQMGRVRISYRESISAKYELLNYQMEKTVSTGTSTGTSNTLGNKPISIGFDVCVEPVYSDFIENVTNDSKVIHLGGNNFLDLSQLNLNNSQTLAQGTHTQGNGKCSSDFQAVKDTIASSVEVSMYQGPTLGYILNNVKTTISNLSLPPNLLAELQQQHSQSPQKTSILSILRMAIIQALKQAISGANPVLLQPVMNVSISTTPEYLGPILSMLETFKSTKIISISSNEDSLLHTGQDENAGGCDGSGSLSKALLDLITVGHNDNSTAYNNRSSTDGGQNSSGINEISAIIPLYNLIGFSSTLRKLTAGTASFSMQLNGFDRVEESAKGHILKELRGF